MFTDHRDLDARVRDHGLKFRTRLRVDGPIGGGLRHDLRLPPELGAGLDGRGAVGEAAEAGQVAGVGAFTATD